MSKVMVNIDNQQIEKLVEKLPMDYKIKLIYKLERETLRQRWNGILKDIDKRLGKFPVSGKEISEEITAYRKDKYAKSCS